MKDTIEWYEEIIEMLKEAVISHNLENENKKLVLTLNDNEISTYMEMLSWFEELAKPMYWLENLSVRTANCLKRNIIGFNVSNWRLITEDNVRDLVNNGGTCWYKGIKNLGLKGAIEVEKYLGIKYNRAGK